MRLYLCIAFFLLWQRLLLSIFALYYLFLPKVDVPPFLICWLNSLLHIKHRARESYLRLVLSVYYIYIFVSICMFLFCFLNLQKCQKTELLSACDLCRDMICMLKKHHSTRVKAFILIQRNQKYHSAISHGKPLSSEGRNTRKLAPMR